MPPKSRQDAPAPTASGERASGETGTRLYRHLAQKLLDQLTSGQYAVGDRLPPERDLALEYNVSRPTLREAIIALEVQGFVEVRVGSGAYVTRIPGSAEQPGFHVTAFELTEARLVIEGEAAALAATHITDEELDALDTLVQRIAQENRRADHRQADRQGDDQDADRAFHMAIAHATRNGALYSMIEQLWRMRASSPETALLLEKARAAKVKPVVAEHSAIARALRSRDPRAAMRGHLAAVLDHLLFATEEVAVEQARKKARSTRERFAAQLASGDE